MADLITVQEFKNVEGITGQKEDQRLDIIVPQVSDLAKKYCGTSFVDFFSTDKTEFFNIDDNFTSMIILSESPVTTIDSVHERTTYADSYSELTTANYEYYFDQASDAIIRTDTNGNKRSFPKAPFVSKTWKKTNSSAKSPLLDGLFIERFLSYLTFFVLKPSKI